jgi:hypothetical protein
MMQVSYKCLLLFYRCFWLFGGFSRSKLARTPENNSRKTTTILRKLIYIASFFLRRSQWINPKRSVTKSSSRSQVGMRAYRLLVAGWVLELTAMSLLL